VETLMPSPDLEGFRQAQIRLREKFGRDCIFLTPIEREWPLGVPLNTETGRPFDPTIEPSDGGGFASASMRALVIDSPPEGETTRTPAGWFEEGHMVLSLDIEDDPSPATHVSTFDQLWEIRDIDVDGLGDEPHRRLVHLKKVSD
jgi:hypothetical protein